MPALEVPVVPRKPWGFACLAMNVLLPGTGTLVAAGNQESRKHLAIGIVQLALFWLVLPWLWSILWGALQDPWQLAAVSEGPARPGQGRW